MGRPRAVSDETILAAARQHFLLRGGHAVVDDIARELGVSHTTLFNRFGSKEGLMRAALSTSHGLPALSSLNDGPHAGDIRVQLIEHACAFAQYFEAAQAGLAVLQAAGIDVSRVCTADADAPTAAINAFVQWLGRARADGRLACDDIDSLVATLLGALNGWVFAARLAGETTAPDEAIRYVERVVAVLWQGLQPRTSLDVSAS